MVGEDAPPHLGLVGDVEAAEDADHAEDLALVDDGHAVEAADPLRHQPGDGGEVAGIAVEVAEDDGLAGGADAPDHADPKGDPAPAVERADIIVERAGDGPAAAGHGMQAADLARAFRAPDAARADIAALDQPNADAGDGLALEQARDQLLQQLVQGLLPGYLQEQAAGEMGIDPVVGVHGGVILPWDDTSTFVRMLFRTVYFSYRVGCRRRIIILVLSYTYT